jgi:hypothetical protein
MRTAATALAAFALLGCAAVSSEMRRAEEAYDQARFDHARVWLVSLERHAPAMPPEPRARYFYLRGMAEYRLSNRLDALYYLEVAHELVGDDQNVLREEQREILTRTLAELEPTGYLEHRPPPAPPASE